LSGRQLRQVECVRRHPFDYRDLSRIRGDDIRPALLRELTDLYVQKPSHTIEEELHFTELALRLIEHVDAAERARLGAQLAAYPGAPLAVILRLAEPDPIPPLQRPFPDETRHLPRLEEPQLAETLSDTFFNAVSAERRLILSHLDYAPVAPASVLAFPDTAAELERAAMTRQRERFALALAQNLSVGSRCAQRIAEDTTGEAVIVALKALAVPSPAVQRILLFLDPAIGQSAETYFALVKLYDELGETAARRMVAIWRQDHAARERKSEHRAQFFDDTIPRAREFSTHSARPAPDKSLPPASLFGRDQS
jgi:hypothetical protein